MFIDRRTFVKGAAVAGAAAVAPQVLVRTARGADKNKVLFVSEESNPKAIAVYDKINADFKKETGIEVVMEYPGLRQHRQARGDADRGRHPARDRLVRRGAGDEPGAWRTSSPTWATCIKATGGTAENLRMVYKGADRSIPTSQQFTYGWYRKDLFDAKKVAAPKSWDDYLKAAKALNDPPNMYGCIVPSAETGASTLLLETMFMKNDVHWFEWNAGKKEYEVALDKGNQKKRAIETLDYLNELHKFSPEASTYNWGELMSTYFTEKAASS